ncbi:MAG: SDR family NAD(P)-dependent oxidoreductase, partial [Chitinophagaceae bacterium]
MSKNLFESFSLLGKQIWVVGGAGYLGQGICKLLVQSGANVLCIDLLHKADEFVGSFPEHEAQLTAATLDIRDGEAIKKFVRERTMSTAVPDGLVILTFGSTAKSFDNLTEKDFDEVNHTGLTSTFLLAREVGMCMAKKGKGSIVLFSSMYGSVSPDPEVYESPMN